MEQSKTNLKVVRRFYDAYNKKDEKILDEVIAENYVDHGHQPPGQGIEGAKNDHRQISGAFQDARFDIDDIFAADDRVAVRWTLHGTQTGPFAGLPATQKKVVAGGMSFYRLRDGKIIETRNVADLLTVFMQVGAVQKPKEAA
jgi:steroid delta-isomerase-like uncharacterized protein